MTRKRRGRGVGGNDPTSPPTSGQREDEQQSASGASASPRASGFQSIAAVVTQREHEDRERSQFEDDVVRSSEEPIYSRFTSPPGFEARQRENVMPICDESPSPSASADRYSLTPYFRPPPGFPPRLEESIALTSPQHQSVTPLMPRVGSGRGRGRGSGSASSRSPFTPPVAEMSSLSISPATPQGRNVPQASPARPQHRSEPSPSTEQSPARRAPALLSTAPVRGVSSNFPSQKMGTIGRKIGLYANYFAVDIPHGSVYHYDIDICKYKEKDGVPIPPPKPEAATTKRPGGINKELYRKVVQFLLHQYAGMFRGMLPVYDGFKNIITRNPIQVPFPARVIVTLLEGGQESKFWVTVKPVQKDNYDCEINLEPMHECINGRSLVIPQECIMAIDIILRHGPSLRYVPVGRSFFEKPRSQEEVPLGPGKEIWFGYYQSLRPGWKPLPSSAQFYLNIDRSATAFYKSMPVLRFLMMVLKLRDEPDFFNAQQLEIAKKKLRGVKIVVTHQPYARKYTVKSLTHERASQVTFDLNGQNVSVVQYFQNHYSIRLRKPNYPCIVTTNNSKLPLEVCVIADNQAARGKLDAEEGEIMVKNTAIVPRDRFADIQSRINDVKNYNRDVMKEFDIDINCSPLKMNGRVLPTPQVQYDREQKANVKDGQWEMRGKAFIKGTDIQYWVVIALCRCYPDQMYKFAQELQQSGQDHGVKFAKPISVTVENARNRADVERIMKTLKQKYPMLQMALVVLEAKSPLYKELKKISETDLGLITQCVVDKNLQKCVQVRPNQQNKFGFRFYMNLCQKINAKMGGTNTGLTKEEKPSIFRRPVIIVGADVTHPRCDDREKFSIAAVVGSLDSYPSRYTAAVELQRSETENKAREETILKLQEMMKKILTTFLKKTNGHFPEKIIYYRDGVSEGQFEHVRDIELIQIRNACASLRADYKPQITFIVVQKRHHTRFMPQDYRDGTGSGMNVPAGTLVDTHVTHGGHFNFYLCSHVALQGTSRPGHYNVLFDDSDFSADELQKLTFYLCHTYSRCTKSISVPPPVMYADLAAYRAKLYIDSEIQRRASSASSQASNSSDVFLSDEIVNSIILNEAIENSMYYV